MPRAKLNYLIIICPLTNYLSGSIDIVSLSIYSLCIFSYSGWWLPTRVRISVISGVGNSGARGGSSYHNGRSLRLECFCIRRDVFFYFYASAEHNRSFHPGNSGPPTLAPGRLPLTPQYCFHPEPYSVNFSSCHQI